MKPFIVIVMGLVLVFPGAGLGREVIAGPIGARLLRVVDGDTLAVRALIWPGQRIDIKVRLAGIDTPELFRPRCPDERRRAVLARDFVVRHTGPQISLSAVHLGKYAGRVVARVQTSSGEDLSTLLLKAGLARKMADHTPWCS